MSVLCLLRRSLCTHYSIWPYRWLVAEQYQRLSTEKSRKWRIQLTLIKYYESAFNINKNRLGKLRWSKTLVSQHLIIVQLNEFIYFINEIIEGTIYGRHIIGVWKKMNVNQRASHKMNEWLEEEDYNKKIQDPIRFKSLINRNYFKSYWPWYLEFVDVDVDAR